MNWDEMVTLGIARGANVEEEQRCMAVLYAMEYPLASSADQMRHTLIHWNATIWAPSSAWRYPWPMSLFVFWTAYHFGVGHARRLLPASGDPYCYLARVMYMATTYSDWDDQGIGLVRMWAELLSHANGECDIYGKTA